MAAWESIPESERPFQRRLMEIFAGFTEHADAQAGRLIDEIERQGEFDNTLILYIWGDNGSSSEGLYGTISEQLAQNGIPTKISQHLEAPRGPRRTRRRLAAPRPTTCITQLGPGQAAPLTKAPSFRVPILAELRNPLAVSWPKRIQADKTPRSQFHHVNDIVPTIYDILEIQLPQVVNGFSQDGFDGVSIAYTFDEPKAEGRNTLSFSTSWPVGESTKTAGLPQLVGPASRGSVASPRVSAGGHR